MRPHAWLPQSLPIPGRVVGGSIVSLRGLAILRTSERLNQRTNVLYISTLQPILSTTSNVLTDRRCLLQSSKLMNMNSTSTLLLIAQGPMTVNSVTPTSFSEAQVRATQRPSCRRMFPRAMPVTGLLSCHELPSPCDPRRFLSQGPIKSSLTSGGVCQRTERRLQPLTSLPCFDGS